MSHVLQGVQAMEKLLYGAAYYDEYMPYDRLEKDIALMKKAHINVVRIAESTWATCEPQEGVFDFSHVVRVMDAMEEAGISVIIGTPTYAVPSWMVKAHPDILVTTKHGRALYGPRQIMDLSNAAYRFYCERVIRKLMQCTAHRKCVIGYQLDNETKYYGTAGDHVQQLFIKHLRKKFHDDLDALNHAFGLDYWSNRIHAWEDFPDVRNTINGSLAAEFDKFRRALVTDFLTWQANIVNEYRREDQFVTHNLDFEWRGFSYGVHPDVDHRSIAPALTVCGTDIYHNSQDQLTGIEIAMGGDLIRPLKHDNYLVLETLAQGFPQWTPYQGQLRLQAFSHLASGANSVMYWHWHSIHNACETYWKGLLSHDFEENDTYLESCTIGREFDLLSPHLINLKKKNDVAILVSNTALSAIEHFPVCLNSSSPNYNDIMRKLYDTLYRMNVECDFIWPENDHFSDYKAIFVPALYAASDELIEKLNQYVLGGGHLFATFKTAFTDEYVKVRHDRQPHGLTDCFGVTYNQFATPQNVYLKGAVCSEVQDLSVSVFLEALKPTTSSVLASYDHYNWQRYAAITQNQYGKGTALYMGCMVSDEMLEKLLARFLKEAEITISKEHFPLIIREGTNQFGKRIRYLLHYAADSCEYIFDASSGMELLSSRTLQKGDVLTLGPWDVKILEF